MLKSEFTYSVVLLFGYSHFIYSIPDTYCYLWLLSQFSVTTLSFCYIFSVPINLCTSTYTHSYTYLYSTVNQSPAILPALTCKILIDIVCPCAGHVPATASSYDEQCDQKRQQISHQQSIIQLSSSC